MNPEREPQPQILSPEEIKKTEKSRELSDAELIKGGAKWETNEKGEKTLKITEEQRTALEKREMEEKKLKEEIDKEMEEKEKEVKEEIEKKYREALASLFSEVQSLKNSDKNFLEFIPEDKWRELIEEIPLFSEMQEGGKRMFIKSLVSNKEFLSPNPEVFIEKGMEVLDIFIHIAILKESSNRLLQERQARREAEAAQFQFSSRD